MGYAWYIGRVGAGPEPSGRDALPCNGARVDASKCREIPDARWRSGWLASVQQKPVAVFVGGFR